MRDAPTWHKARMSQTSAELTPLRKEQVVVAYRTAPSLSAAAKIAGVSPDLVYKWKGEDDDFAAELAEARLQYADHLRELVQQRAVGIERVVVYKGEVQYRRNPLKPTELLLDDDFEPIPLTETVHSDRMLELLATAVVPEVRSSKRSGGGSVDVSVPGAGGGKVEIQVNFVEPPDWDNVEWDDETGRPKLDEADPLET